MFQEKRLCLSLLYSLLSQYRLKEAQELGDHMASLLLQNQRDQTEGNSDDISPSEGQAQGHITSNSCKLGFLIL